MPECTKFSWLVRLNLSFELAYRRLWMFRWGCISHLSIGLDAEKEMFPSKCWPWWILITTTTLLLMMMISTLNAQVQTSSRKAFQWHFTECLIGDVMARLNHHHCSIILQEVFMLSSTGEWGRDLSSWTPPHTHTHTHADRACLNAV